MPLGVSMTLTDSGAQATLTLAAAAVRPINIHRWAAGTVAGGLRDHFKALAAGRHGSAFPGSRPHHNFYADAARTVQWEADEDHAEISVPHRGLRLRWQGGIVRPVNAKMLAIAARAEAYGRRPGEFDNLQPIFFEHGAALVEREQSGVKVSRRKKKDGSYSFKTERGPERGGGIMFWLVKQTTHRPDPSVMPDEENMSAAVLSQVRRNIAAALIRGLGNS